MSLSLFVQTATKFCFVLPFYLICRKHNAHVRYLEYVHMRGEMNSYRFEISNRRENKFCSHEVSFRLHFKITRYSDEYVGISFRVVFTRYFITRNEISFLSK